MDVTADGSWKVTGALPSDEVKAKLMKPEVSPYPAISPESLIDSGKVPAYPLEPAPCAPKVVNVPDGLLMNPCELVREFSQWPTIDPYY
jgi:hypothetical protein